MRRLRPLLHAHRPATALVAAWLVGCTGSSDPKDADTDLDTDPDVTDTGAATALAVTLSPEAPTTLDDLVVTVTGAEADEALSYTWVQDAVNRPDIPADTVPATQTSKGQTWTVTVTAAAPDTGATPRTAQASVTVVNAPPTATVSVEPSDPTSLDEIVATATFDDPDGDEVEGRWLWVREGVDTTYRSATLPPIATSRGESWQVVLTPDDGEEDGDAATADVVIGNAAPTVSSASISPSNPTETSTLTASRVATDPDGDPLTTTWTWYVGGTAVPGVTGNTLDGADFDKGDVVWVEAMVDDGQVSADAAAISTSVVVGNSPPDFTGVVLSPDPATEATELLCEPQGWDDPDPADPPTYTYAWTVANQTVAGIDTPTLTGEHFDRNQSVSCAATAIDDTATGPTLVSNTVSVVNAPPTLDAVEISEATPAIGDTLSAVKIGAVDLDDDPITYTHAWYVDGLLVSAATSLTSANFSAGQEIVVEVTPSDGSATGPTVTSPPVTVLNSLPTVESLILSPSSPTTDDTLIVIASGDDADNHPVTFTYTWYVDGTEVQSGASNTLDSSLFDKDDEVYATVTPSDPFDPGMPQDTVVRTIVNTVPSITGAQVTPQPLFTGTDATCEMQDYTDADPGDPQGGEYAWTVNGAPVGGDTPTLSSALFERGDQVRCTATPDDGDDEGAPRTSNPRQVVNTPPTLLTAVLSNPSPGTNDTLSVTPVGGSDADGDVLDYRVSWYVSGSLVLEGDTLDGSYFAQGDTVYAEVAPFDGFAEGDPVTTDTVTVINGEPTLSQVYLDPSSPDTTDPITCVWEGSDPDGETLTPTFSWTVNGQPNPTTGAVLDPSFTEKGRSVRCTVSITDGLATDGPMQSNAVSIVNAVPTVSLVEVVPGTLTTDSLATCTASGWNDPDGDPEDYIFRWFVNGDFEVISETLDGLVRFDKNDTVYCTATPFDGTVAGTGEPVASEPVLVANTPPTLADASLSPTAPRESDVINVTVDMPDDADADVVTYQYAWSVDGQPAGTLPTLDGSAFDRGQSITVTVTPTDGIDTGPPVTSDPVVAVNTPPVVLGVLWEPNVPSITDTLEVLPEVVDDDDDPVDLTFTFYVDGSEVQSGPAATLAPGPFESGSEVYVEVQSTDGIDDGLLYTSPTITIDNTPPELDSAAISPTDPTEDTILSCTPSGWFDLDGDAPGYLYSWSVNGTAVGGAPTLGGGSFDKGDEVTCTVTPNDGTSLGDPVTSDPVTILNSPPEVSTAVLSRLEPVETNTITVILTGVLDRDGDPITRTTHWFVNGTEVLTADEITGADFDKGDDIYAVVDLSDGEDTTTISTNAVTVLNTLPTLTSLQLGPSTPTVTDGLQVAYGTTDADGDPVTVTLSWFVDDQLVPGVTGDTLPAGTATKHEEVYVIAVANDGEADGPSSSSNTVTVINTPPVLLDTPTVTPGSLDKTTTAQCTAPATSDADGDPVSVSFQWQVAGTPAGANTELLPFAFGRGQSVQCFVTPFDGEENGEAVGSTPIVVSNTPPSVGGVVLSSYAPREGVVITTNVVDVVDLDGDLVDLSYRWEVNGTQVATTTTLDSSFFDKGDQIQAFVTPDDSQDSGAEVASPVAVAANTPPECTSSIVVTPASAKTDDTLTATVSVGDDDGDPVTVEYVWEVNGGQVLAGPGNTLDSSYFQEGQTVTAMAVPYDADGPGSTCTSSGTLITNTIPTAPTVEITPTNPNWGVDDLTCSLVTTSFDPDPADVVFYEFRWRTNGQVFGNTTNTPTSSTLPANVISPNDTWFCDARASDGQSVSPWSPAVNISQSQLPSASCADLYAQGLHTDGLATLSTPTGDSITAHCDMSTAGGGWTRVARTRPGQPLDVGQATWDVVSGFAPAEAAEGVDPAFDFVRDAEQVLLVARDGDQAGRWARFDLFTDTQGLTLLELLHTCRDAPLVDPTDPAALAPLDRPAVVGPTTWASGQRTGGDLEVYDPATGLDQPVDHVTLCGLRPGADAGATYLAFTHGLLFEHPADHATWGPDQARTLWSFASGPYPQAPATGPALLGTPTIQGLAGEQGVDLPGTGTLHDSRFEVYVR